MHTDPTFVRIHAVLKGKVKHGSKGTIWRRSKQEVAEVFCLKLLTGNFISFVHSRKDRRDTARTRSSAQGNCSAKSLAGNVTDSSLSSLSSMGVSGGRGGSRGKGFGGRGIREGEGVREGEGTFHPPCHILHYHMVLLPKGTSHKKPMDPPLGTMNTL